MARRTKRLGRYLPPGGRRLRVRFDERGGIPEIDKARSLAVPDLEEVGDGYIEALSGSGHGSGKASYRRHQIPLRDEMLCREVHPLERGGKRLKEACDTIAATPAACKRFMTKGT